MRGSAGDTGSTDTGGTSDHIVMLAAMNPSLRRGDATTPPEVGPAPAAKRVCAELTPVQQGEINNTIKTRRLMRGFGYLLYIRFACQKKSDKGK
ncbi:MAG: hypothetical protein DMG74_09915 [Acidobacteria bacterium]|nr:MAG: hypothetical protein DMG74_09915 [Acidobacteriota bacterium]